MKRKQLMQVIRDNRNGMLRAMRFTVSDLQATLERNPEEYTEPGTDEPAIDIRLCIDPGRYIIRTGLSDYDLYHSRICAASCVTLETEAEELLNELIEEAENQICDLPDEETA